MRLIRRCRAKHETNEDGFEQFSADPVPDGHTVPAPGHPTIPELLRKASNQRSCPDWYQR